MAVFATTHTGYELVLFQESLLLIDRELTALVGVSWAYTTLL